MRLAHADDVPLLLLPEDTRCHRCDGLKGNEPHDRRFGPTKAHVLPPTREGRRRYVNRDAFHRCERGFCPRRPSRSRRPHVTPMAGDNVLIGLCKRAARFRLTTDMQHESLLALRHRKSRFAFSTPDWKRERLALASPRLGLTTQARHRGSV